MVERDLPFCQHLCMNWPSWADGGTLNQLTVTFAAPALSSRTTRPACFMSHPAAGPRSGLAPHHRVDAFRETTEMRWRSRKMPWKLWFFLFFFVGSPSLLSVQRNGAAFPKRLASVPASGAGAASLRCRWALCGVAVMMQVDQFEFGEWRRNLGCCDLSP